MREKCQEMLEGRNYGVLKKVYPHRSNTVAVGIKLHLV